MTSDETSEDIEQEQEPVNMHDDNLMREALEERRKGFGGETQEEPDEQVEDVVEEGDTEVATEDTTEATEPEYVFELEDGTKVTADEAKAGYLRHADYTRKTQDVAEKRKRIDAIVQYHEANPDELKKVIDWHSGAGNKPQPQQAAPQVRPKLEVPDDYKGQPFIESLVGTVNTLQEQLAATQGTQQQYTEQQKQREQAVEMERQYHTRLTDGYRYLEGKIGTLPPPQEFEDRIIKHFQAEEIDPQAGASLIIGPDRNYIRTIVDRAFSTEIKTAAQDKANSEAAERKKGQTKKSTLRTTGKGKAPNTPSVPRTSDGKLDRRKTLHQIIQGHEELKRR